MLSFLLREIDMDVYGIVYVVIPMLLGFLGLVLLVLRAVMKDREGSRARKMARRLDRVFEVIGRWADRAEEDKMPVTPNRADTPPAPAGDSAPREPAAHDHIPSTALDGEEGLRQLDRLLEAGLIDREEYRERRKQYEGS